MINYNPEGSLLRRDQKELLSMLEVLEKICRENNIKWWLSSGTLLGAARHQGFIPWDDDVDLIMPRKEYERFLEIAPKNWEKSMRYSTLQRLRLIGLPL